MMSDMKKKEPKPGCPGGEAHQIHLCRLMELGRMADVDHLTEEANFTCRNCGAYAGIAAGLCNPEPF